MLTREGWLRVPLDLLQEQIVPTKVEGVAVAMAHLMVPRRVHDEASDALGVVGPEAGPDHVPVEGPVRGDASGHEGFVIGRVEDGVSVEPGERNADHWKAAIIGPV